MKQYHYKDIIKELTLGIPPGECSANPVRRAALELLILLQRNPEMVPDVCYTKESYKCPKCLCMKCGWSTSVKDRKGY